MIDLNQTITLLRLELSVIDRVISGLEDLARVRYSQQGNPHVDGAMVRRRGRKSMGPEERKEVSRRMKAYWDSRREKR